MTTQPEALRLAEYLFESAQFHPQLSEDEPGGYASEFDMVLDESAAELRRLHEVETKYHESVGGFKRDLAEKLEQQRKKNIRLTDELRRLEKDYVARNADLRRLHEVNAELVDALLAIVEHFERVDALEPSKQTISKAISVIAKATGEQHG